MYGMFVIVDLEWITDENGHYIPTQLAASRVNEDWDSTGLFSAFIKPKNTDECIWSHPSYTGGNYEDFHIQPRKFLSYTDVVEYIKRHDTNLIRSSVAV